MPQERQPKTWIEISRSALLSNAYSFQTLVPDKKIMGVIKANAYGHGLPQAVEILEQSGVVWYGVDSLDEALAVREAGGTKPVLILGYTPRERAHEIVFNEFRQSVYDIDMLRVLSAAAQTVSKKVFVHLKIETGTNRQGVRTDELAPFIEFFRSDVNVVAEGAYTHFADVEDSAGEGYAAGQLAEFARAIGALHAGGIQPAMCHAASTAAILLLGGSHFDMVRLGIGLYGLWPSAAVEKTFQATGRRFDLQPVLRWKTIVAQVKSVPSGAAVGYGLSERVTRDSRIAIIPVGYYDGIDRGLSSLGEMLIHGMRAKIIGRVCMDICMVDVTDIPNVKAEDEVVIIGFQEAEQMRAEELAARAQTIHYEVVARINPFIPRRIVE